MVGRMSEEDVTREALRLLHAAEKLPRLVVFDLDYTLWPFWCECLSMNENPSLYPEAKGILTALKQKGVTIAVASRTPTPDTARCFLHKLTLLNHFADVQIFPSWSYKVEHFQNIQNNTGIPVKNMLFFDDEDCNIQAVSQLGVTTIMVDDGVTLKALGQGLQKYNLSSNSS